FIGSLLLLLEILVNAFALAPARGNVLGGLNLTLQNINSSTSFGINKNMILAFNQYSDTKEYYDSYHRKNLAGNILMWGGLAVVLGGAYYPLFALNSDSDSDTYLQNVQISLGVMLGGLVTELIGAFILPAGQESLFKAVNLYNRHKIKEFESRKNQKERHTSVRALRRGLTII
ncbi:hypothetical protein LQZ19_04635, partial [Treponema primitia]|uniref:hypothetical protein n=1 Tax=Treponema primitia TaxID=88058 RepID=UPI0039814D0C